MIIKQATDKPFNFDKSEKYVVKKILRQKIPTKNYLIEWWKRKHFKNWHFYIPGSNHAA